MLINRFIQPLLYVLASVALFMLASQAFAMDASPAGTGLPGEQSLTKIVRYISGPVAYAFVVAGLIALAAYWAMGSQLDGTVKGILGFVIGAGFLAFSVQVANLLFTGATVPDGGIPADEIVALSVGVAEWMA